jgi:hypothetical protein
MTSGCELALMIWGAAVAADKGELIEAAEILENAARQLRRKGDSLNLRLLSSISPHDRPMGSTSRRDSERTRRS